MIKENKPNSPYLSLNFSFDGVAYILVKLLHVPDVAEAILKEKEPVGYNNLPNTSEKYDTKPMPSDEKLKINDKDITDNFEEVEMLVVENEGKLSLERSISPQHLGYEQGETSNSIRLLPSKQYELHELVEEAKKFGHERALQLSAKEDFIVVIRPVFRPYYVMGSLSTPISGSVILAAMDTQNPLFANRSDRIFGDGYGIDNNFLLRPKGDEKHNNPSFVGKILASTASDRAVGNTHLNLSERSALNNLMDTVYKADDSCEKKK